MFLTLHRVGSAPAVRTRRSAPDRHRAGSGPHQVRTRHAPVHWSAPDRGLHQTGTEPTGLHQTLHQTGTEPTRGRGLHQTGTEPTGGRTWYGGLDGMGYISGMRNFGSLAYGLVPVLRLARLLLSAAGACLLPAAGGCLLSWPPALRFRLCPARPRAVRTRSVRGGFPLSGPLGRLSPEGRVMKDEITHQVRSSRVGVFLAGAAGVGACLLAARLLGACLLPVGACLLPVLPAPCRVPPVPGRCLSLPALRVCRRCFAVCLWLGLLLADIYKVIAEGGSSTIEHTGRGPGFGAVVSRLFVADHPRDFRCDVTTSRSSTAAAARF